MKQIRMGNNRITEGVIWKQILIYFFPLLFGTFFQQLYNTADAIVVGRFVGKEALSAVGGPTGVLINVFVGFFVGVSSGATVAISQFYGADSEREVSKAVHTAMALAIVSGAIIMIMGIIGTPFALQWMGTPKEIMPSAVTYLRIYFAGMIANLIYNVGAGILRAIGDSRRPLYFLIASCFINIVLDILFVLVFHWGVAGAALATIISQLFSAVMVCLVLIRTKESYKLYIKQIRFHPDMVSKIVRIGIPAGLQSLMYSLSNLIIQASINGFGTNTVAAWTAYTKIDGIFWMTMGSFGISITTFVGQNYGAGKRDRVMKGIKVCLLMTFIAAISLSIPLYFGGSYVYRLFTDEAVVIEEGMLILRFLVPTFFTYVFVEILSGSLRGMGNSFVPMILCGLGICALRVVWLLAILPHHRILQMVLVSYPLSWTLTSLMFIFYFLHYVRKKNLPMGGPKKMRPKRMQMIKA